MKESALAVINAQVDTHQSYLPIFLFTLPAKFLAQKCRRTPAADMNNAI